MAPVAVSPEITIVEAATILQPRVAAKGDRFVVIWSYNAVENAADVFVAARSRSGAKLLGPTPVDDTTGPAQSSAASVGIDKGGNVVSTFWSINNLLDAGVRYRQLGTNGQPAGAIVNMSPDFEPVYNAIANSGYLPVVTGLGSGRFLTVWGNAVPAGPIEFDQALRLKIVGSNAVSERSIDLDTDSRNVLGHWTRLAALPNGGFSVVWRRMTGPSTASDVMQLHSASAGKVGPRVTLPRVYGESGDYSFFGDVAPLPDNGVLYVWRERDINVYGANTTIDTFVQRYSAAGKAVGKPIQVNDTLETQTQAVNNSAIAGFADGRSVVVWTETRVRSTIAKSRDVIMGQLLLKDGTPSGRNFEVATDPDFSVFSELDVATLDKTRFVVTYRHDLSNGKARVAARLFDTASKGVTRGGKPGKETVTGGPLDDVLVGKGGADTLNALAGDDLLDGGAAGDTLNGGAGSDTVRFSGAVTANLGTSKGGKGEAAGDKYVSVESAIGSAGADRITGTDEFNAVDGGKGNDFLKGGGRGDKLVGGPGGDTFYYDSENDIVDTISDFVSGSDKLVFENNGFTSFTIAVAPKFAQGTKLPASASTNTFTFFFHRGLRRLYYSNGFSWIEMARLPGTAAMRKADIVVQ